MSRTVYSANGLTVTRLVGPAALGFDRRQWEVYADETHGLVRLNAGDVRELVEALKVDATYTADQRRAYYYGRELPPGADPL